MESVAEMLTLFEPITFGDSSGDLGGHVHASAENTSINTNSGSQTLIGDVHALHGHAVGGDDTLSGSGFFPAILIGDAVSITDHARGGDDDLSIGARPAPVILGDAVTLSGHAEGGNDHIDAAASVGVIAYGDAETMTDHARGGNDLVEVSGGFSGDIFAYGDAKTLSGSAVGGDDTVTASTASAGISTEIYGDGAELLDHAKGGNDRLISGIGDDRMWGDAAVVAHTAQTGADTFVFAPNNGHDRVMDFEGGTDHIELNGFGFTKFSDIANDIQYNADGALITFDSSNSIAVVGVNHLSAEDFVFS